MNIPIYWIDAFTQQKYCGNPAAVIPLENWLENSEMQLIAYENGLAETAFFVPSKSGQYHLRWFTPKAEVDLCGHATLATAFTLFNHLGFLGDQITFNTRSGDLVVTRTSDDLLRLNFPSRRAKPVTPPTAIIKGLGKEPTFFAQAEANLAVFATVNDIRSITPDFAALATLEQYGTIATAPGDDCDFVSRFFAPRVGVNEDPVTGSAHCVLTPYWADRLGKNQLHAKQLSHRGGEIWCELHEDRVHISGHARLYLEGMVSI